MSRTVLFGVVLQLCLVMSTLASSPRFLNTIVPSRRTLFSSSNSKIIVPPSQVPSRVILSTRGGGALLSDDESSDNDDYEEELDEIDVDFFDANDFDITEHDDYFAEENTVDRMLGAWKTTPPLTKAYLSASFAATMMGYVTNHNQFPKVFLLEWKPTFYRLQLWRPLTAFLNFGPLGLGYVMTAHFVWTYMSTLERLNHHRPYDFWIMIVFGMISMVAGYGFFRLEPKFLGHNLSTFLVYIWARYHEGMEVNMFELFNTRAELLPWFFLAQVGNLKGRVILCLFLVSIDDCVALLLFCCSVDVPVGGRNTIVGFFGDCVWTYLSSLQNDQSSTGTGLCHQVVRKRQCCGLIDSKQVQTNILRL